MGLPSVAVQPEMRLYNHADLSTVLGFKPKSSQNRPRNA